MSYSFKINTNKKNHIWDYESIESKINYLIINFILEKYQISFEIDTISMKFYTAIIEILICSNAIELLNINFILDVKFNYFKIFL